MFVLPLTLKQFGKGGLKPASQAVVYRRDVGTVALVIDGNRGGNLAILEFTPAEAREIGIALAEYAQ